MKSDHLFLSLAIVLLAFVGSGTLSAQDKKKNNKEEVVFFVEKMHCDNCKATIEKYIAFEKGVTDMKCDLADKLVTVTYDAQKTNPEKLQEGFSKIKYPAVIVPAKSKSSGKKIE